MCLCLIIAFTLSACTNQNHCHTNQKIKQAGGYNEENKTKLIIHEQHFLVCLEYDGG